MKISPRYTDKDWNAVFAAVEDWDTAINIVEDRIRGRWLDAADQLIHGPHSGFAILALDCIALESLWGFINGKAVPQGRERQVYQNVLTGPRFGWTPTQSEDFRQFVRNGLIHDAETRKGWVVGKASPSNVVPQPDNNGGYRLNRTKFHRALKATFEDWIGKLHAGDAGLRNNMRDRMNEIIAKHAP